MPHICESLLSLPDSPAFHQATIGVHAQLTGDVQGAVHLHSLNGSIQLFLAGNGRWWMVDSGWWMVHT